MDHKKKTTDLHGEIIEWKSAIALFKDEIPIFEKELAEVEAKNTDHDARAGVERFQNDFIAQKETADELLHELNEADRSMARMAMSNPDAEHISLQNHKELEKKATRYQQVFAELKMEFRHFIGKWM